jgi:hypothetical protein
MWLTTGTSAERTATTMGDKVNAECARSTKCGCPCRKPGMNVAHIAPCCDPGTRQRGAKWPAPRSQLDGETLDDLVRVIADMHRPSGADPNRCLECQREWPCYTRKVLLDYDADTIRLAARRRREWRAYRRDIQ